MHIKFLVLVLVVVGILFAGQRTVVEKIVKADTLTKVKMDTVKTIKYDTLKTIKIDTVKTVKIDTVKTVKADTLKTIKLDTLKAIRYDTLKIQKIVRDTMIIMKQDTATVSGKPIPVKKK